MKTLMSGGEPFLYPGGDVGCLLVHGFPGAPESMRWMGHYLAEQGFSALGVRLFGLATQPADANRAHWRDWLASVEDGYHILRGMSTQVVMMGHSTGGALSLLMAREFPVAGVVVMATPNVIPDIRAQRLRPLTPLITKFWRYTSDEGESDWHDKEAEKLDVVYEDIPTRAAGVELHDVLEETSNSLSDVTAPLLLIYAEGDGTTPAESAQFIYDRVSSTDKEVLWLKNSGHSIPRDAAHQEAFEATANFVRRVTQ